VARNLPLDDATQARADVELMQSLAATHAMFGRIERAISFLHLGLWVIPRDPETLRLLAVLSYRMARYEDAHRAILDFEQSGEDLPEDLTLIRLRLAGNRR